MKKTLSVFCLNQKRRTTERERLSKCITISFVFDRCRFEIGFGHVNGRLLSRTLTVERRFTRILEFIRDVIRRGR